MITDERRYYYKFIIYLLPDPLGYCFVIVITMTTSQVTALSSTSLTSVYGRKHQYQFFYGQHSPSDSTMTSHPATAAMLRNIERDTVEPPLGTGSTEMSCEHDFPDLVTTCNSSDDVIAMSAISELKVRRPNI